MMLVLMTAITIPAELGAAAVLRLLEGWREVLLALRLPVALVFVMLRKQLMTGRTAGAVKE
jgi:ABC-type maltose transport system permease subunit